MSKQADPLLIDFDEGATPMPMARPTNVARTSLHVLSGLLSVALMRWLPGRAWLIAITGAITVAAWTMEISRRYSPRINARLMRFFKPIAHSHERHHTNSSTWYVTALLLMAVFAPLRAAELGVLVLGVGDPAAGLIGRRFGRTRLSANRSLEGSLSFVVVGFAASFAWLLASTASGTGSIACLAMIASLTGAVAELASSQRFDDNFTVPISIAVVVGVSLAYLPL